MEARNRKLTKGLPAGRQGFTIIEVLIVLAIAGLILAIVFLAVPALQRNSRNNSRINDAAHLAGLVNDYAANHAGQLPTGEGTGAGEIDLSGENWALMQDPIDANFVPTNAWPLPATVSDRMNVNRGFRCVSEDNSLTPQARSFAITFRVETSGGLQNRCLQG